MAIDLAGLRRFACVLALLALLALLAPLTAPAAPAAAPGAQAFAAGVALYRDGEYEAALDAFLSARKQGMQSRNLDFNLGLTHYRLGSYFEARAIFLDLRQDLQYTAMADYHLGLIAAQLGDREQAEYHFAGTRAMAGDPALRRLADEAMRRGVFMDLPRVDDGDDPDFDVAYYLLLGTGYDTNPALVSDSVQEPDTTDQTAYLEVSGDARQPLFPRLLGPYSGVAAVRLRDYSAHEDFDEFNGELGLRRDWRGRAWQGAMTVTGGLDTLGGDMFQRVAGAEFDLRRVSDNLGSGFGLELRSDRIAGGEGFEYLEGWRHRAGLDWRRAIGRLRLRGDYDYTINDRSDLSDEDEFFSHSPRRHSVGLAVGRWFGSALSLEWRARYRDSRYADPDRFVRDGASVEQQREEQLASTGLRSRMLMTGKWNWLLDYQFSRNRSTRDAYDYDRHLVLLALEWLR